MENKGQNSPLPPDKGIPAKLQSPVTKPVPLKIEIPKINPIQIPPIHPMPKLDMPVQLLYASSYNLERLEWGLNVSTDRKQIKNLLEPIGILRIIASFDIDIGNEANSATETLNSLTVEIIPPAILANLRTSRARWDSIIRERINDLYLVTPKSKIDPKHLLGGISKFLTDPQCKALDHIVKSDLNEACKCILVGSATAAEYIALRAAEGLLRKWYQVKTGKTILYKTWGVVLDQLVAEYPEEKRPKEIALLGYLKMRRNEIAHPERISTLAEAETTLMNVFTLICGIDPFISSNN